MSEHRELVLIVEDDVPTAQALAGFLRVQGYESTVAENGREAIDLLRSGVRPCLILLDIMMPVMDGWDFREAAIADPALATIPMLVVTADLSAIARASALQLPLVKKPVDPGRLISEVARYC